MLVSPFDPPPTRPPAEKRPTGSAQESPRREGNFGQEGELTVLRRHDQRELGHRCLVVAFSGYRIWRRALLIGRN